MDTSINDEERKDTKADIKHLQRCHKEGMHFVFMNTNGQNQDQQKKVAGNGFRNLFELPTLIKH